MKRAVGYARYSSDNQREESIDAQIRAIQSFCNENDYKLIEVYVDEALSASSAKERENFLRMIQDSKNKTFEIAIVHKFDRFARNRYDHAIYEKKLNDNGVKLLSVLEPLNDSPESVILKSVLTGMNEYYILNLSREVKKGLKENALKCIHTGGTPPLGYDVGEDRKYVINELEADSVRIIYKMYLEGAGYRKITEYLNKIGRVNKRKKPFKMTSIRDILLNEKYIGTFVFGKKDAHGHLTGNEIKIENGLPAIVDKEIFWRVQKKIKTRATGSRSKAITPYYLTGYCTCAECGSAYTGGYRSRSRNGELVYGYVCTGRKSKGTDCVNRNIRKELLENLVFKAIQTKILTDEAIKQLAEEIKVQAKEIKTKKKKVVEKYEKEIEKLKIKVDKILNLLLDGALPEDVYKEKSKELNDRILFLKLEIEKAKKEEEVDYKKIVNFLQKIRKDFHKEEIKKSVIETFVHSVKIGYTEIEITLKKINSKTDLIGGSGGNRTRVRN